jgi:hypothetical protein
VGKKTIFVVPGQEPFGAVRCAPAFAAEAVRAYSDMAQYAAVDDLERFAALAGCSVEEAAAVRELWRADVATFGPTRERSRAVTIQLEA